jgi:hypothetical protein
VTFEAEEDVGFVGTGALSAVTDRRDGRRLWSFHASNSRDAAYAAGRTLRGFERNVAGTQVRVWYDGEDTLVGNEVIDNAVSAVGTMSASYGSLSQDEVEVVSTRSPLGGMEYPGLVFVSAGLSQLEGLPLIPDLVRHAGFDREQLRYVTGHEVAHQWWYSAVGSDQVREPWLDEGFAETVTRLWLLDRDGHERTAKIANLEALPEPRAGQIDKGVGSFEDNSEYSASIYDVGSAVLLELRDHLGRDTFDDLLSEWHRTKRDEIGTIEGFVDLTGRVGGRDARLLLERYLSSATERRPSDE